MSPTQPSHAHHRGVPPTPVGKNNFYAELHELLAHQMRRGNPPLWAAEEEQPWLQGSHGAVWTLCWDPGAGDCKGEHNAGLGHQRRVVTLQAR